jgi:3-oxoadipate enol-lactonase
MSTPVAIGGIVAPHPELSRKAGALAEQAHSMRIGVNGIQINVRDRGKGEPSLVFLHYWGGSSRTWTEVVDYLANQHRSIALDHRGWGESDAPSAGYGIADLTSDALGVVRTLELQNFVVVGHSMGGKVAQLLASRRPAGLKGLILVAPSPPSPTILSDEQREQMLHVFDSPESIAYARDHILSAMPLTNAQKERVIEDSLRGGAVAKDAWPNKIILEDIRAEVRHINVPTLVLSGEHDQVHPVGGVREEVLSFIPGAKLQIVPGAGHAPMLEAPEFLAQSIRRFAAEL